MTRLYSYELKELPIDEEQILVDIGFQYDKSGNFYSALNYGNLIIYDNGEYSVIQNIPKGKLDNIYEFIVDCNGVEKDEIEENFQNVYVNTYYTFLDFINNELIDEF